MDRNFLLSLGFFCVLLPLSAVPLLVHWEPWKSKMTGCAVVISRRVEYRHGWRYITVFALGTMELELETTEYAYHQFSEGQRLQILWKDHQLLEYLPE